MEYTKKLLTLGQDAPLDYSNLGFGREHADELIRMATAPTLLNADTEFWAAVHAWRILGQLKVTDAIAPLLDLCEQYDELDLLFDDELPKAIALMGQSAIPELRSYLFDDSRDDISHS